MGRAGKRERKRWEACDRGGMVLESTGVIEKGVTSPGRMHGKTERGAVSWTGKGSEGATGSLNETKCKYERKPMSEGNACYGGNYVRQESKREYE